MTKITVVGYEGGYQENILIYTVDVNNPQDEDEVTAAVQVARDADLEDEANPMRILFAFAGDLLPLADWRV